MAKCIQILLNVFTDIQMYPNSPKKWMFQNGPKPKMAMYQSQFRAKCIQ